MRMTEDYNENTVELLNGDADHVKPPPKLEISDTCGVIDHKDHSKCSSSRWTVAYMGVWLGIMIYIHNTNMSVAIVCMVTPPTLHSATNLSHQEVILHSSLNGSFGISTKVSDNNNKTSEVNSSLLNVVSPESAVLSNTGEFTWSKESQSLILSGYYYGKILVHIPAGWFCARFGGRRVVGYCMSMAFIVTMLIPVMARTSVYLVVTARVLLGTCVSMGTPTYYGLAGNWALPTERSRFMALFFLGETLGAVIGYSSSGFLCTHGFGNGWDSILYMHGIFGMIFVVCWYLLIYSSPEQHPRISESEKLFIRSYLQKPDNKAKHVPWRKILTYSPNYAIYAVHFGGNWILYLMITSLPMFMKEILQFDVQSNGFLSSLPFITLAIGVSFSGATADYIRSKDVISVTRLRKLFVLIGFFGIAIFILIPGYLTVDSREIAIVTLCICALFESMESTGGYGTNAIDIAPRYSSVIYGISNTVASLPGAIVPIIVAAVTKNQTVEEWRIVFYLSAGVGIVATAVYLIVGDSEQASWSKVQDETDAGDIKYQRTKT